MTIVYISVRRDRAPGFLQCGVESVRTAMTAVELTMYLDHCQSRHQTKKTLSA